MGYHSCGFVAPAALFMLCGLSSRPKRLKDEKELIPAQSVQKCQEKTTTNTKKKNQNMDRINIISSKKKRSFSFSAHFLLPTSTNLLKPHNPPLRLTPTLSINCTALPLLIPTLPSLFRLPSPPLAELVFALLATGLCDGRRGSEADAVDAFAVVA